MVAEEKVLTRQLIRKWHERAQIDYSELFVNEYIAYNAWFRKVTDCDVDHEAIKRVMKRFVIWDDYLHGRTLIGLKPIADKIARFTQVYGDGLVKDSNDWKNIIYFWYQTRCDLFHGVTLPGKKIQDEQIKLAYESLNIFMIEIMRRMRFCFSDADYARLTEADRLLSSPSGVTSELAAIKSQLHQKFIQSPDLWNVDMERV